MKDHREAVEQHPHLVMLLKSELTPARGGDDGAEFRALVDAHGDLAAHPTPADAGDGAVELVFGAARRLAEGPFEHHPGRLDLGGEQPAGGEREPVDAVVGDHRGECVPGRGDEAHQGLDVAALDRGHLAEEPVARACFPLGLAGEEIVGDPLQFVRSKGDVG